ncbi:MAG: hypothetical protein MUE44_17070 [Oscillatoriaceae cyanobacterium Prado104]|jgi:hypothetical protein|nr:hypothetical protein [Oscillatoriaceae cyanobacterium Prado104]
MKIVALAEIIAKFADYFRVDRLEESALLYIDLRIEQVINSRSTAKIKISCTLSTIQ